ncbi:MAG: transporter substrate-binding domain-containing protein [Magnetococcales bacterium]|nr:transporter substrate-binding domain-containing protein [Magnetococcales bacterium]
MGFGISPKRAVRWWVGGVLWIALVLVVRPASACEMTIYGNAYKPPKSYLLENTPKGILVDMTDYIAREVGCRFTVELYSWTRSFSYAKAGKGAIIGFSKTAERLKRFDYSIPMYFDEVLLVVRKDYAFPYQSLSDLKDKRIGAVKGGTYGGDYEIGKEKYFTAVEGTNPVSRLKMLMRGRLDASFVGPGKAGFNALIASDANLSKNRHRFELLPTPFNRDSNHLGILKTHNKDGFMDRVNGAIRKGWESGAFQQIIDSHH